MKNLYKACAAAVARQEKAFGAESIATKIRKISETDELYIIDFYTEYESVVYGGGGLIVDKKDFSVDFYCIPSYPSNIFEIIGKAVEVEVPKEYAR